MKKTLILSLVILALLASCTKEGTPQHKGKIKTITASKSTFIDGEPYYDLSKHQAQEWQWDGNQLFRIDYTEDDGTYNENFFYNWRHQIVKTTVPAYNLSSVMEYDGRKLQRISLYEKEELVYLFEIAHDGRHANRIVITKYTTTENTKVDSYAEHLIDMTLGDQTRQALLNCHPLNQQRAHLSKGCEVTAFDLTWEKDNLVEIRSNDGYAKYTYDDKINPFHNVISIYEMDNPAATSEPTPTDIGFFMMSKNNVVSNTERWGDNSIVTTYTYQYDEGKFPTQCKSSYSFSSFDSQLNEVTMRVDETRDIVYE